MRFSLIVACAGVAPVVIAASQPVHIQPSSQWVVDYAEDSCRLIRMFGEGDLQTRLVFESVAPGDLTMVATGKPVRAPGYASQVAARFLPVQQKSFLGTPQKSVDKQDAVLWAGVPLKALPSDSGQSTPASSLGSMRSGRADLLKRPDAVDASSRAAAQAGEETFAGNSTALEIKAPGRPPVILETGSLGDAFKVFRQCDLELLSDLGLDPEIQQKIARPPWAPNPAAWFTADIYPRERVVRGQEASVTMRLLLDAAGRVTKCTALSQFDAPDFRKAVCDSYIQHATFAPAELADGTRVPSYYVNRIVFKVAAGPR